ncbi:hypothetical protein BDR03DRAFT_969259 [Suillus americanus]|nr:hypothetical protein BDR03DRAFT_969259 [Suillus americanus]
MLRHGILLYLRPICFNLSGRALSSEVTSLMEQTEMHMKVYLRAVRKNPERRRVGCEHSSRGGRACARCHAGSDLYGVSVLAFPICYEFSRVGLAIESHRFIHRMGSMSI